MKDIKSYINEESYIVDENYLQITPEIAKMIWGALDVITKLVKEDEFCEALGVERYRFDEFYEDMGEAVDNISKYSKALNKIA